MCEVIQFPRVRLWRRERGQGDAKVVVFPVPGVGTLIGFDDARPSDVMARRSRLNQTAT